MSQRDSWGDVLLEFFSSMQAADGRLLTPAAVQLEFENQTYCATVVTMLERRAMLETDCKVPVGRTIRIGRAAAQVVDLLADGMAVAFIEIVGE
jgi:hypothetical protein